MDNTHAITSQSYACIVYIGPVSDWACKYFGRCSCQAFFLQGVVEDGASHRLTTFIVTASHTHALESQPKQGLCLCEKSAYTCTCGVSLVACNARSTLVDTPSHTNRIGSWHAYCKATAQGLRTVLSCSPCTACTLLQACDQAVIDDSGLEKSESPGLPQKEVNPGSWTFDQNFGQKSRNS